MSLGPELESGSRSFEQLQSADSFEQLQSADGGRTALSVVDALITPAEDFGHRLQFSGCAYCGLMLKKMAHFPYAWQTRRVTLQLNGFGAISSLEYDDDVGLTLAQSGFRRGEVLKMKRDGRTGRVCVNGLEDGDSPGCGIPAVIPALKADTADTAYFAIEGDAGLDGKRKGVQRLQLRSIPGKTPASLIAALAALAWPPHQQQVCVHVSCPLRCSF
jgi:hypothetical protein